MDGFAGLGCVPWCFDCEGCGRSDKSRPINADVSTGADDIAAASHYIMKTTGEKLRLYGSSSGPLRVALYAQRFPQRIQPIALEAMVWTGEAIPALPEPRNPLPHANHTNPPPPAPLSLH